MNGSSEQWAWIVDECPVQTQLSVEPFDSQIAGHAAGDPAVVIALRLRLQGMPQEALDVLSTVNQDADALLLKGQILFEMERFEEATASYGELAKQQPDHPFAAFNRGICLARLADWKMATESLQRAVELDPDLSKAWYALGACLLNQGLTSDARACFSRSLMITSAYAPALFGLATTLHLEGKYSEALSIYERMLEMQPKREELLSNALAAAIELQDSTKITAFATRLHDVHPESSSALAALFSVAADKGNFDEAADWCTQLAHADTQSFDDHYNLAICYQRVGRYENAVSTFERALQLRSDDVEALEGVAQCLSELSDHTRTKKAWRRLLELAPERDDCWFRLGLLSYHSGELAEAVDAFEQCVRLKPDSLDAWVSLATTHWSNGDKNRAADAFDRALKLDPTSTLARRGMAALAIDSGDAGSAGQYLQGLSSRNWDLFYNLAVLQQSRGSLSAAAALYRQVVGIRPDFAEAWLNLGNVLFALGDVREGEGCWRSALEKRPGLAAQFLV